MAYCAGGLKKVNVSLNKCALALRSCYLQHLLHYHIVSDQIFKQALSGCFEVDLLN